jgi:hypothetical protein
MIILGVFLFGTAPHVPILVELIGAALMGIGYAWMGYIVFMFPDGTMLT